MSTNRELWTKTVRPRTEHQYRATFYKLTRVGAIVGGIRQNRHGCNAWVHKGNRDDAAHFDTLTAAKRWVEGHRLAAR